jgi:hypothetical protein
MGAFEINVDGNNVIPIRMANQSRRSEKFLCFCRIRDELGIKVCVGRCVCGVVAVLWRAVAVVCGVVWVTSSEWRTLVEHGKQPKPERSQV